MNKTSVANESFCLPNSPEYYQNCLDYLKGIEGSTAFIRPDAVKLLKIEEA